MASGRGGGLMRYESDRLPDLSVSVGKKERRAADRSFLTLILILLTLGVIMVLSSSYARAYYDPGNITGGSAIYFFVRQLLYALAGVGAMLAASRIPMEQVYFHKQFILVH